MMRRVGLGAALLGVVALAACGGGGAASKPASGGGGGGQALTVKSSDTMRFDPATLNIRANTPVTLTLDNSGAALVHDFVLDSPQVKVEAQPNGRATGTFTVTAPGSLQFYCSQPGHREAGMVGSLLVS